MERRKALKNLTGLAALAFLPKQHLFALQQKKQLHIIGLGTAGTKVMQILQSKCMGHRYTAITDGKNIIGGADHVYYSYPMTTMERDIQECYFPDKVAPFMFPEAVKAIFQKDQRYLLLAGLGGYTATHMSKAILPLLQERHIDFKAIYTLPFVFEGKKKRKLAQELVEMTTGLPQVKYVDNEAMRQKFGNLSIRGAFAKIDEEVVETFIEWC